MLRILIVLGTLFVWGTGCSWQASPTSSPERHDVMFECDEGEIITVQFWPQQERAMLWRGTETLELQEVPTASGFQYVNGSTQIQGKGDRLTVTIGQRAPLECQQQ